MNKTSIITIITLFILLILSFLYYSKKINSLSADNYNLTVLSDSIKKEYNKKTKEYIYSTSAYKLESTKQLKKYDKQLYSKFKNTKKIKTGITATASINLPSSSEKNTIIDTTNKVIVSEFKTLYKDSAVSQQIEGINTINKIDNTVLTKITANTTTVKLKYSISEEKNKTIVKAYILSDKVTVNDVNAVVIEKKQKRFSVGTYCGFGLNSDLLLNNFRLGWSTGICITYRVF